MSTASDSAATQTPATDAVVTQESVVTRPFARKVLAFARIVIGFYFFWAFIDKLFGLGFTTAPENAVINGGTPAQGYLNNALDPAQPFAATFQNLFANPVGDFFFMFGLAGVGISMLLGAGIRLGGWGGALLMLFMYLVNLPWIGEPTSNPIVDSHWIEALLLLSCTVTLAGDTWGLGKWWAHKGVVRKNPWLR